MEKQKAYFYCNVEGNTDVGCKRPANEDWLDTFECQNGLVSVVCDGMGGHVGGQVASHLAVETIREFLCSNYFDDPQSAIIEACNAANNAILQKTRIQPELTGMGSTCVMLIVRNGKVYIGSVGDSRIYLIRSKTIRQLTKDQSYVQMLVDAGQITKEQAEHHPRKNEITNALGLEGMKPATVLESAINPEAGDCYLLCSDGLSGMVSDNDIAKIVSNQLGMSQKERVDALIAKAKKNGGLDNITCQIVEFSVTPPNADNGKEQHNHRKLALISVISLFVVIFGLLMWHIFSTDEDNGKNNYISQIAEYTNSTLIDTDITLPFEKNKVIIKLEENKQFGALVIYAIDDQNKIDTITVRKPVSVDSIKIRPEEYFAVTSKANTKIIQFNNFDEYPEDYLALEFQYEDSMFSYVFNVKKPDPKQDNSTQTQTGSKLPSDITFDRNDTNGENDTNDKDTPDRNTVTKVDDKSPDLPQVNPKIDKPDPNKPDVKKHEVTIKVPGKGETDIDLIVGKGKNTNKKLYIDGRYTFDVEDKGYEDKWYSYSGNLKTCYITIKGKEIPDKNATIKIPLRNGNETSEYIIHVQKTK